MSRLAHLLALTLACVVLLGGGCPSGNEGDDQGGGQDIASDSMGGTMNMGNFTVPSGQTSKVTSDLVINASGNVRIDGKLEANAASSAGNAGTSITINAQGDIDIDGTVQAGDGGAGDNSSTAGGVGGVLTLSAGGNLSINTNAVITSGSGGTGATTGLGGVGGNGADISLSADQALTIRGTLTIGNGGHGGAPDSNGLTGMDTFTGEGGDSGFLLIEAGMVDWPGYDSLENSVDLSQANVQGGIGGSGASVTIEPVVNKSAAIRAIQSQATDITIPWIFSCPPTGCQFSAPAGGDGCIQPGDGGDMTIDASAVTEVTGGFPVTVTAWGGRGGDVVCKLEYGGATFKLTPAVGAVAGAGGSVDITGIAGGAGIPGQDVWVFAGDGGNADCGELGKGGLGGNAIARAGAGGDGQDGDCNLPPNAGRGDPGGGGGTAHAAAGAGGYGYFGGNGGNAEAYGGDGGNGGENLGAPGGGGGANATPGQPGGTTAINPPSHIPPAQKGTEKTVPGGPGLTGKTCP